jgi:hypothetical protein
VSGIKLALAVAGCTVAAAATAVGTSSGDDTTPACFGAAAHDPARPCSNASLRSVVIPSPRQARGARNAPCRIIESRGPLRVCEFGAQAAQARGTIALLGDSHAAHWRAALDVVADAENWRGLSITLSGCPYSALTRVLRQGLREDCVHRNRAVPAWFAAHPEIHTVFVSELSGAQWALPRGTDDPFEAEADAYVTAWSRLPESVERVVVLRDTPKALPRTAACVERTSRAGRDPGAACAVPESVSVDDDAAADAARQLGGARFAVVDMTRYFCDDDECRPVIGGALVQKDLHHLSRVFVRTLGPYLLEAVRRLDPPVR